MPISFIPEEKKKEKKGFKIPFLVWWILVPLLILVAIFYFIFQGMPGEIPESEKVSDQVIELNIQDFKKIEKNLEVFNKKIFKELKENPFPRIPKVPPEKVGRSNPFESPTTEIITE